MNPVYHVHHSVLRDALSDEQLKLLRMVFVVREDYIAELDRYANLLPDNLRTTYH